MTVVFQNRNWTVAAGAILLVLGITDKQLFKVFFKSLREPYNSLNGVVLLSKNEKINKC